MRASITRLRRRLVAGAALTGAVAATLVADASPAAAAASSHIGSNSGGANVRYGPSTGYGSMGYVYNNEGVSMVCWADHQWVAPPGSDYNSNRWFKVNSRVGTGFVHSSLVEAQTSVGRCPGW